MLDTTNYTIRGVEKVIRLPPPTPCENSLVRMDSKMCLAFPLATAWYGIMEGYRAYRAYPNRYSVYRPRQEKGKQNMEDLRIPG
jgi:hypothetical protein